MIIFKRPPRLFLILGAGLFLASNAVRGAAGDREKARIALAAGAYAEAIEYAEVLVTENPTDINARLIMAQAYLRAGDEAAAREEYLTIVSLDPGQADANYGLAVLAAGEGDLNSALDYARAATTTDPDYADAWLLIGKAAAKTGDGETAYAAYVEYLKRRPPTGDIYLEMARVERRRGEPDAAVQYYRLAAEAGNVSADVNREIAATLTEAGQYEEAFAAWAEVDGLTAGEAATVNGIGLWLLDIEEYDAAGRAFTLSAEADPSECVYRYNRALALHLSGDEERAEVVYRELAEKPDPLPEAVYNLAVILDERGDFEAAKEYYGGFLELSANRPDLGDEAIIVKKRLTQIEPGEE
ncbi:MAG: tetratricopeptide repeat protein [Candidatus Coatesbacteria bacterium]|nr:MAG: tetratricopeptide repeat protein [Candidatus Coatesbacteria bacterium]